MSTVTEIKAAIDQLSPPVRCELEALLHPFADDAWDEQMRRDSVAGKFAALHREGEADQAAGRTIPLTDILRES
jgi:hypothetical protein